jgi:thiamine-monophosphate kinase
MNSEMPEFDLIRRLQEIIEPERDRKSGCRLGIGDDAAVLEIPSGRQVVVCTDTVVEGVHFPTGTDPRAIGHKALAVNLSDLAAMGAEPGWFLMALTIPEAGLDWVEPFAQSMASLASSAGITLVGGDLSSGPLSVCVTAMGLAHPDGALTRAGAAVGDLVVVSGRLGAAAHTLKLLGEGLQPCEDDMRALEYPQPRVELGQRLPGLATACIDLSDGLLADLGHILEQSGAGARIEIDCLPCPESLLTVSPELRRSLQLSGGDDYELCFTVPQHRLEDLRAVSAAAGVETTVIGKVTDGNGVTLQTCNGQLYEASCPGYEHFKQSGD